jgi:peptidyl-tRNA hydrolase
VQSIIDALGTQDFTRLRIGIADKELEKNIPPEDFVLGKLNENAKKTLEGVFEEIIK